MTWHLFPPFLHIIQCTCTCTCSTHTAVCYVDRIGRHDPLLLVLSTQFTFSFYGTMSCRLSNRHVHVHCTCLGSTLPMKYSHVHVHVHVDRGGGLRQDLEGQFFINEMANRQTTALTATCRTNSATYSVLMCHPSATHSKAFTQEGLVTSL